jgi:hypothetical protein
VCEEDAGWLEQYQAEADRLEMPHVVHLDRCSALTRWRVAAHRLCVGTTRQDGPAVEFRETHKQMALDVVAGLGYDWAMAWDVDETYEAGARQLIAEACEAAGEADCIDIRWLNLWGDVRHIRADGSWLAGHRVKMLNLQGGRRWRFDHPITNGPKLVGREGVTVRHPLVCLHHGMMTPEMRRMHKARWDRIYSTALRGDPNPYGFWASAIESEDQAVTVRHGYTP